MNAMKRELFEELLESVKQAVAIERPGVLSVTSRHALAPTASHEAPARWRSSVAAFL
jgi:hypothetical protein